MYRSSSRVRLFCAVALVLAPLLLLVATLVDITPQAETNADLLALVAENPSAWSTGQLLFFVSGFFWVPAGWGLVRLFGHRSRLGRTGAAVLTVGGVTIVPVDAAGLYIPALASSDLALADQTRIVEAVEASAGVIVFEVVHVVGLLVGLVVVAIAVFRSRVLPVWVGVAVLVTLVGMLAAPGPVAQAAVMTLLVAGLGTAAVRVLGMSDADWSGDRQRTESYSASHS